MGLTLSIDDFGTGYCSLAYLRDLPVDLIKIDKAFILDGPGRLHDAALTRCIIDLGHTLGLEVLAEGVSSAPIEQALRQLGCDLAQGDLYGRPMDEAAFVGWLAQVRPPVWEPA
jgi:EAL domain-containing protein (putative c-di-GMP-specific phosphodiesterase class I)